MQREREGSGKYRGAELNGTSASLRSPGDPQHANISIVTHVGGTSNTPWYPSTQDHVALYRDNRMGKTVMR